MNMGWSGIHIHHLKLLSFPSETYGDEALYTRVEDYREKWLAETAHYVEVKKDVEELQSEVEDLKGTLKDIEKG